MEIYTQMPEPKWCISMGACASSGGVFDTYTMIQGVDQFMPVDVYIPGCPPRPEGLIDALMLIQKRIKKGERQTQRYDRIGHPLEFEPVAIVSGSVQAAPELTGTRHTLPAQDLETADLDSTSKFESANHRSDKSATGELDRQ